MLLSMLHAQGIHGTEASLHSGAAMTPQVGELESALKQERERAQALAQENAAVTEKLASLQAAHEHSTAAAATEVGDLRNANPTAAAVVSDLKNALARERERVQALARAYGAVAVKLAGLRAMHERTAAAAGTGK
jgi:hypothetical protein